MISYHQTAQRTIHPRVVVGATVRFTGDYLREIGVHSGPLCSWRGTVLEIDGMNARVELDHIPIRLVDGRPGVTVWAWALEACR